MTDSASLPAVRSPYHLDRRDAPLPAKPAGRVRVDVEHGCQVEFTYHPRGLYARPQNVTLQLGDSRDVADLLADVFRSSPRTSAVRIVG